MHYVDCHVKMRLKWINMFDGKCDQIHAADSQNAATNCYFNNFVIF